jgi:hypothetical protein
MLGRRWYGYLSSISSNAGGNLRTGWISPAHSKQNQGDSGLALMTAPKIFSMHHFCTSILLYISCFSSKTSTAMPKYTPRFRPDYLT